MDGFEPFGGHHDGDLWPGEVFMRPLDGKLFRQLRTTLEHRKWVVHYWDIEGKTHMETSKAIFDKLFKIDLRSCDTCGRHPVACICLPDSTDVLDS